MMSREELLEKHGKDLLDYEKCTELLLHLRQEKDEIEKELDLSNEGSSIGQAVKSAEETTEKLSDVLNRSNEVISSIQTRLNEVDQVRKELQSQVDDLHRMQAMHQYMKIMQKIDFFNNELKKEMAKKEDERCATIFANLCEISRNLANTPAANLRAHLKKSLHFWHEQLKAKFSGDFDDVLKAIKWPFVNANFSLHSPNQHQIKKLEVIAEYLLQIELPSETVDPFKTSALLSNFPPLCLPIDLLVQPLRKRFLYHFYGARQTNRVDKPEWYFTQVLTWIRDHSEFVVERIQPVIDKMGLHHIDAKLELIRGLVQLTVEKLNSDLKTLQLQDFAFSHSIDEALGFNKELRESYDYPSTQPSILAVLTQAEFLRKWIRMEKKYATEKMDSMFSSTTIDPFELLSYDIEDLKITICADSFITLLQTITDRYESLPQPGHRIQFLDLQLELLDDFRIRLLQLVKAEQDNIMESRVPAIANTIYYVENVLIDWGAMLHYLNLYYYKTEFDPKYAKLNLTQFDYEIDNVFGDTLLLFRSMRKQLLLNLSEYVLIKVKSQSRSYRSERWSAMTVGKDIKTLSLTPTACPIFEVISRCLHQLQKSLTQKLFRTVWTYIAEQLDSFLFEDLVLDSRFNEGGALQFKYDVTRNLLPLFSSYSNRPDAYFINILESCSLLNLAKGSALLLRETLLALEGATGVEDTRKITLKELGVVNFTPRMAVQVLNRRTDITINRMVID